jgi:hypothetical protein
MNGEIIPFGQILYGTLCNLDAELTEKSLGIYGEWKNVLCRIKSVSGNEFEGRNMAEHSRVVDLQNGNLIVEVDHQGWMELIRLHKKFILTGLKMKFPQVKIKNIFFRLNQADEKKSAEKNPSEKFVQRMENEEKFLRENFKNPQKKSESSPEEKKRTKEIPPELQALFDDLKKSMLTNAEK